MTSIKACLLKKCLATLLRKLWGISQWWNSPPQISLWTPPFKNVRSKIFECFWNNSYTKPFIKLNFSITTPVFIATWSFRNHSNVLIYSDYYQSSMFIFNEQKVKRTAKVIIQRESPNLNFHKKWPTWLSFKRKNRFCTDEMSRQ